MRLAIELGLGIVLSLALIGLARRFPNKIRVEPVAALAAHEDADENSHSGSTKMRPVMPGAAHSEVEVTNISKHGFWLLLDDRELFLPFEEFPWFQNAPIGAILRVERPHPHHLYWPDLDVDLAVDSIENLDRYPFKARMSS